MPKSTYNHQQQTSCFDNFQNFFSAKTRPVKHLHYFCGPQAEFLFKNNDLLAARRFQFEMPELRDCVYTGMTKSYRTPNAVFFNLCAAEFFLGVPTNLKIALKVSKNCTTYVFYTMVRCAPLSFFYQISVPKRLRTTVLMNSVHVAPTEFHPSKSKIKSLRFNYQVYIFAFPPKFQSQRTFSK